MKLKKIIRFLTLAILLFAGAISCTKETFNINLNPNQVTDSTVTYNVVLPAALNNTGRVVARNWGWLQNYLGYWARSGTYAPNTQEETYELTTSFNSNIWTNLYDNLYDYQAMQISANKAGADFYVGIARIMKAHDFAILVDIYNDLPYQQALGGASNTTPKYDKANDIYKDLLRQLDTGISLIKNADLDASVHKTIATDDIMFSGNKVLWAQFANTLKLRLLTHCMNGGVESSTDGSVGSPQTLVANIDFPSEFDSISVEGSGFLDQDASINLAYAADKGNPFYNLYVTDNTGVATSGSVYYKANSYGIGYYQYNSDPRTSLFYKAGAQGLTGVPYGLPSNSQYAAGNLAGIGDGLTGGSNPGIPQRVFTGAESYFLQAECQNRGFLLGDAAASDSIGIIRSFQSLYKAAAITANGNDTADAQDYILTNQGHADVDYRAGENLDPNNGPVSTTSGGLYTIISQKWFALNGLAPFEVWSDYRRVDFSSSIHHFVYGIVTGYDAGPPISVYPSNSKTEIPVRLLYPQSEYLYNPANVNAEPAVGAYPYSHIFWDLN